MIPLIIALNLLAIAQPLNAQPTPVVPILSKEPKLSSEKTIELKFKSVKPSQRTDLITQERGGNQRRFEIPVPPETEIPTAPTPVEAVEVVEVIADRQEYDYQTQVITAEGNVVMNFAQAVLTADRLQVNLNNRIAVAQGQVVLKRGEQVLKGERFEYYLVQDRGVVVNAQGEVDRSTLEQDLSASSPNNNLVAETTLSDRLTANQPLTDVTATEEVGVSLGSNRDYNILEGSGNVSGNNEGATINRLRFQAARMEFEGDSWQAEDFRLTNDPFSPPELELRAKSAQLRQIAEQVNQLTTTGSRIVIDDSFTVPLLVNSFVIDNRPRQPGIFRFGFDGEERGGLYLERSFSLIDTERVTWEITPQYFLQKALFPEAFDFNDEGDGGIFNPAVVGVRSQFNQSFSARTSLQANLSLTSLDLDDLEDNLRTKVALQQQLGNLNQPHTFSLEYNFRERLFNGSLGFQTVYSSIGGIITSPNITLGKTGLNLTYQGSIQNINANTDREELLESDRDSDRINLTRYQAALSLNKGFPLWQGKALPPTQDGGLRYTPVPVVPYLKLNTEIAGVSSFYSNDDDQQSLRASVGIEGQFGHFSRNYLDYTGFNLAYSQGIRVNESPFLFDRYVDQKTLSLGISQQLYGPVRFGVQTSFNLDNSDEISTDYVLEYSRRTHNVTLRYNPVLEIGSISFRLNGFNWRGDPRPFESNDISPVVDGVSR